MNHDHCRCPLTPGRGTSILPGDRLTLEAYVPAPTRGRYVMEFDLVAEGVCWFANHGSRTVRVPIEVL